MCEEAEGASWSACVPLGCSMEPARGGRREGRAPYALGLTLRRKSKMCGSVEGRGVGYVSSRCLKRALVLVFTLGCCRVDRQRVEEELHHGRSPSTRGASSRRTHQGGGSCSGSIHGTA